MNATITATIIPSTYNDNITRLSLAAKNAPTNKRYTGILAEHDMNGTINIVINLSFSFSMVLVAIIPGTPQPNPKSIGMNALPCNPTNLCISLSITNAALAK